MPGARANPSNPASRGAVALLSGGLDSAVAMAAAMAEGIQCAALTIDYGQRHRAEIDAAGKVARRLGAVRHEVIRMDLRPFAGSALTGAGEVPKDRDESALGAGIPTTYVPARNMVFLSLAVGWAESQWPARDVEVIIGVNAVDFSGYPDCREGFIRAFEAAAREGTRAGAENRAVRVHTPLAALSKAEIIQLGATLGVDFSITRSCYDPDASGRACGRCDACAIRRRGFEAAAVPDPTEYTRTRAGSAR
ncbi:MAG: 7-cyano-7-deazaguanine synthase QueC [Phycisphaerales bacterium]|nr:7-cyano-7-deazaguanine synthase QueC [Phycisphaerales bacterium]